MKYLITFESHYDAIKAKKKYVDENIEFKLLSSPREISASCSSSLTSDVILQVDAENKYIKENDKWILLN